MGSVRQRPKPRKKRRNLVLDDDESDEEHEMPDGSMMEGAEHPVHETSPPKRKPNLVAGKRKAEASQRLRAKRRDDMFVDAPKRQASKASQSSGAIEKGARLTEDQKLKLEEYISLGGRNKKKYSQRARMYMLRGSSFEEAKRKAESRDSGEASGPSVPKRPRTKGKPGAGHKFMDDTAGVGK